MENQRVSRKISLRLALAALVVSAIVFAAGVFIGLQLSQASTNALQSQLDVLQAQTSFTELASQGGFGNATNSSLLLCPVYADQLKTYDEQTEQFRLNLEFLSGKYGPNDSSVMGLESSYDYLEARDYLNILRINNLCGYTLNTALFFFTPSCPTCDSELSALAQVKQESNFSVFVYSFDGSTGQPAVDALEAYYNASPNYPVTIINGHVLYGEHSAPELASYLLPQ